MKDKTHESGPYFKGQTEAVCGCYYPDVTRIRDDAKTDTRILHCIVHGEISEDLVNTAPSDSVQDIPTDEWREKERRRLRAVKI